MPDLLNQLAAPGCARIGSNWDRCGAYFVEPIEAAMTTLTMRMIKGHFVVSGPDVEPMKFKSRREARDWCKTHHPGSPITEVGPGGKRAPKKPPAATKR